MPWTREFETMSNDFLNTFRNCSYAVSYEGYRMRNPIDSTLFNWIAFPLALAEMAAHHNVSATRFKVLAMPRGEATEDISTNVVGNIQQYKRTYNQSRYITIYNTANNAAVIPVIVEDLIEQGWKEVDYRTALTCTPFHTVRVFVNETNQHIKHICIFTNVLSDGFILKLGAVLSKIYEITIPDAAVQAYLDGNQANFVHAFDDILKGILEEAHRQNVLRSLDACQTNLEAGEQQQLNSQLRTAQSSVENYTQLLHDAQETLQDVLIRQASTLWKEVADYSKEFIDYIKQNDLKNITKADFLRDGCRLRLQVITALYYWDEELFKNYFHSPRGNCMTDRTAAEKALLKNIFLDRTVLVKFHTGIEINFGRAAVNKNNDYLMDGSSQYGIAHTHTYYYNCWGNNAAPIEAALIKHDYIVAWEQIKAAMSNLNMSDSCVVNKFVDQLFHTRDHITCLELKNKPGRLSPGQFIKQYPEGYIPEPVVLNPDPKKSIEPEVE